MKKPNQANTTHDYDNDENIGRSVYDLLKIISSKEFKLKNKTLHKII